MLNELLLLKQGLKHAGMRFDPKHPDIKAPGRFIAVHVRLDAAGRIAEIASLSKEETSRTWTLRDGQHNSFPFVKVGKPFCPVEVLETLPRKKGKAPPAERREQLLQLASVCHVDAFPFPSAGFRKRLEARLKQLEGLKGTDGEAVPVVIERFLQASASEGVFLKALLDRLVEQATDSDEVWLEHLEQALIEPDGLKLFLDVEEGEYVEAVLSNQQIGFISRILMTPEKEAEVAVCALTGELVTVLSGSFPQPNLPVLGQSFLFSKNSDIPAAKRYRKADSGGFPVGQTLVAKLAVAIEYLTRAEARGRTWQTVAGEKPKTADILVGYVDGAEGVELIRAFIAEDEDEDEPTPDKVIESYQQRVERIFNALEGKRGDSFKDHLLNVALFRAVDPANRKIIYHRALTVAALEEAARDWVHGEANVPDWIRLGVKKGAGLSGPEHVDPAAIAGLTREKFVSDGKRRTTVTGVAASTALDLFLTMKPHKRFVAVILKAVLDRFEALLQGVAARQYRFTGSVIETKEWLDHRRALQAVTLLGILLHKLGRTRWHENEKGSGYMNETAFKLGQMLAALDQLHAGYCVDVRRGDIPPTLLGNGLIGVIEKRPIEGMVVLERRIRPYMTWAKKFLYDRSIGIPVFPPRTPEEMRVIWNGVKQLAFLSDAARLLHDDLSETAVNEIFYAELLLGYLAGPPKVKVEKTDHVAEAEASAHSS